LLGKNGIRFVKGRDTHAFEGIGTNQARSRFAGVVLVDYSGTFSGGQDSGFADTDIFSPFLDWDNFSSDVVWWGLQLIHITFLPARCNQIRVFRLQMVRMEVVAL